MQSQTTKIEPFGVTICCAAHVQNSLADGEATVGATFSGHVLTAILQVFAQAGYGPTGVLETLLVRRPLAVRTIDMLESAIEQAGEVVVIECIRQAVQELSGGGAP